MSKHQSNTSQENILIVDDVANNLRVLAKMLTQAGYHVRPSSDGTHAISAALSEPPDLILLDIMMPGMDGYQVCERLQADERTCQIPIIFISAKDEVRDKVKAFAVGGVDYITKPFQAEEVLARVETHLTIRNLRHRLQTYNETLEAEVKARTAELSEANTNLQAEIIQRKQNQLEKDKLLEVTRQQSDQLRELTKYLIEAQKNQRAGLAETLHEQVGQNLILLQSNLNILCRLLTDAPDHPANELITTHLRTSLDILAQTQSYLHDVTNDLNQPAPDEQDLVENPLLSLSTREREVLQLVADGQPNPEIAAILCLSESTVRTYRNRIMKKLNIDDVPTLVKFAIKHDLTSA